MGMTEWRGCTERYNPEDDSIELVDPDGDVVMRIHRNGVIRMLGMLPSEPPEEDKDDR